MTGTTPLKPIYLQWPFSLHTMYMYTPIPLNPYTQTHTNYYYVAKNMNSDIARIHTIVIMDSINIVYGKSSTLCRWVLEIIHGIIWKLAKWHMLRLSIHLVTYKGYWEYPRAFELQDILYKHAHWDGVYLIHVYCCACILTVCFQIRASWMNLNSQTF